MKKINSKKNRVSLSCERCGAKNFSNKGALAGHQKQGHCAMAAIARTRVQQAQVQAHLQNVVTSSSNHATELLQDSLEFNSLLDDEFEPMEVDMPKTKPDSNLKLLQFIRTCRNTVGLSRVDIDSLLSTLFHTLFRLEEVTFRNWRDVEKYESTKCDFEDVS